MVLFGTCKKASRADSAYIGHWIDRGGICEVFIDISESNTGNYYTVGGHGCGHSYSGTARVDWSSKHLYIGKTKFKILEHPTQYTPNPDSIRIRGTYHKLTGLKMTLKTSFFHARVTREFVQYK